MKSRNAKAPFDSVLLIGFGGPGSLEDVEPFLRNVVGGRPIPEKRLESVKKHYTLVGGRSPYNELTFRQMEGLMKLMEEKGPHLPVYAGMRNWQPTLEDALRQMVRDGRKRAIGFVLAPHRSEASWERYQNAVKGAQEKVGPDAPQVEYCPPWHTHPLFIEAIADRARQAETKTGHRSHRIYSAHSIPVKMAAECAYESEVKQTAEAVNAKLGDGDAGWSVAYQSRSGHPKEPWIGPDVKELIEMLSGMGETSFLVVPIGFLVDHMEVLYDLDIEASAWCKKLGVKFIRAGTVSDHPSFLGLMRALIEQQEKPVSLRVS